MHLRTLTIKGFKSFAEPGTLELDTGVTAVVGPNGSGKSNIVDAIAWVLGAQGPSTVRSGKMDDVIFAGTSSRPALGRAEVELVIDNSDGVIPVDLTEVTIRRTLFRSGDSEYALNGVPCRLLDITELLSDAGVGRTQHVIVSQGQLDEVLKARPVDRRAIIEEAAGILKFRKRKEKAERRLASTEANMTRVTDLLREVRRQLRPLEKQADAARRHGDVAGELRALRLHLSGREIASTRARLTALATDRQTLAVEDKELKAALAALDADVAGRETELGRLGADEGSDDLVLGESLREKALGLRALVMERKRRLEREREALLGSNVVASIEGEAARLAAELAETTQAAEVLDPERTSLDEQLAALEVDLSRFESLHDDEQQALPFRAGELRGELAALRGQVERASTDLGRRHAALPAAEQRLAELEERASRAAADVARLTEERGPLAEQASQADASLEAAVAATAAARERRTDAERTHEGLIGRVEALELALANARTAAGAEALDGLDGVLGTLLDLVAVADGYEVAFEAALGEALRAVVVADRDVARVALDRLRDGDASGAVLALGVTPGRTAALPLLGDLLRQHVTANRPEVEALLDALLAEVIVVEGDWRAAADAALAHPEMIVVSRAGDRFAPSGWRVGAGGAGATGAALEDARRECDAAAVVMADATAAAAVAETAETAARTALEEVTGALRRLDRDLDAAAKAGESSAARHEGTTAEVETLRESIGALEASVATDGERIEVLAAELEVAEREEAEATRTAAERDDARRSLDERARSLASARAELDVRASKLDERRGFLEQRLSEARGRLADHREEAERATERRERIDTQQRALDRMAEVLATRLEAVDAHLGVLRAERRHHTEAVKEVADALDALRAERARAETSLEELRERERRIELDEAEQKVRLENLVAGVRTELDVEPEVAVEAPCPEVPEGSSPRARARELERELKIMGPINPLALQEFAELTERHEFLESQLDDVKSTRRDLHKVIRKVDHEIVEIFSAAYTDVAENFAHLFDRLFPGGTGKLKLTEPDNLLDTGIELEAKPAGKNVKQLSLLSGGERSLTAMAFLFAVFRSRPSPFYVLDEVEAALDDVNISRFLDLVEEFRREAQLVIVTHQKRTMEAGDCLYGVSMQPGGSTKLVSERLDD